MAPKAKIPAIIECHSEPVLREELEHARASLSLAETEETWDTISNTLLRIMALLKGGACEYPTTLTSSIRSMYRPINSAAASERSRLSAAAVDCIAALATGLGPSFDPLVPLFIPTLLSLCSRPNKVFISRAKVALQTIIDQTQLISLLSYFAGALHDKSVTLRLIAIESVLSCVQCLNPPDLEKDARARDVENSIRLTATDPSAEVRKVSRNVFDAYKILLPSRVESFTTPLSPTMKKYLNIDVPSAASRPPSSQSTYSLPATRPTSSMAPAPPKQVEPHPRPATSMAHHRSASSSTLASNAPSAAITSKLTRSQTEHTMAPPNGRPAPGPSSKRKDNMPPPAVIPRRRPQVQPEPSAPLERPSPTVRPHPKGAERPPEASSSRTVTQILRPDSMQPPVPSLKPHAGPLRGETMSIKERLLGGAQRVLLPETQQQAPAPPRPLLPPQEKKASAEVQIVSRRSRLDSVRHGPKSTATIDAKRAVNQVAATPSAALERPGASSPTPVPVEKKEIPKLATQVKKDDSKPPSTAGAKGGNSKIPNVGVGVKKEGPKAVPSASDRPKSSMSTRSTGKSSTESKVPRKRDNPKAAAPTGEKKCSQPAKGTAASASTVPAKKVAVRTGGVTQPTLSQLARKKASEEEKERRLVAKGGTKGLMIRPKGKVVAPKAAPKEAEVPAAAITTPLPPSPETRPADVPLPASPMGTENKQVAVASTNDSESPAVVNEHPPTPTPVPVQPSHPFGIATTAKTPISALVSSIQRGFLFSPNSPLSPVQPDAEWECPAWPGLPLNVGEAPSFEGVEESTVKRLLVAVGTDGERKALVDMN